MTTFTEDELRQALAADAAQTPPPVDVWPQLRRRVVVRHRVRMGAVLAAAAVAAVGIVVSWPTNDSTARLPVARGETSVLVPNRALTDAEMQQAIDTLRQRLDALGVSGATISTHEGAVQIDAPGLSDSTVAAIAVRGVLQWRSVVGMQQTTGEGTPPQPGAAATLSGAERAYAEATCPVSTPDGDRETTTFLYLVACDSTGSSEYLLGPAELDNGDVAHAGAVEYQPANQWLVDVTFTSAGRPAFLTLTADAANKPPFDGPCDPPTGCNAIAIVVDGAVLAAPSVELRGGIRSGVTQITGELSRDQARALAAVASTKPLPTGFTPGS